MGNFIDVKEIRQETDQQARINKILHTHIFPHQRANDPSSSFHSEPTRNVAQLIETRRFSAPKKLVFNRQNVENK
jgi:hypothetical protein